MNLRAWAYRWGVPLAAVLDLEASLGMPAAILPIPAKAEGKSEAYADSVVQLEAAQLDILLFRNNVGALFDEAGRLVRYGLANESKDVNEILKSSDRIGLRPKVIRPEDVGTTVGQFVAREIKEPGWRYTGTGREPAQLAFIELIVSKGGDAAFATGAGSFD